MTEAFLSQRVPAQAVIERLHQEMGSSARRGPLARLLGASPIPSHARSWYVGAVGEIAVARVLSELPEGWLVLHSVPIGQRGSDIDHVLLSPEGRLLTLNTKHHPGGSVWVSPKAFYVNGHRVPYLRNSAHEAKRAAACLTRASGRHVEGEGLIVIAGAKKLTHRGAPGGVAVVTVAQLRRFLLRAQPSPRPRDATSDLMTAALRPSSWDTRTASGATPAPMDAPEQTRASTPPLGPREAEAWFSHLRREVAVSRRRALGWTAGGVIAAPTAAIGAMLFLIGPFGL